MKNTATAIAAGLLVLALISFILPFIDTSLGLKKGSTYRLIMAAAILTALLLAYCHFFKRK